MANLQHLEEDAYAEYGEGEIQAEAQEKFFHGLLQEVLTAIIGAIKTFVKVASFVILIRL